MFPFVFQRNSQSLDISVERAFKSRNCWRVETCAHSRVFRVKYPLFDSAEPERAIRRSSSSIFEFYEAYPQHPFCRDKTWAIQNGVIKESTLHRDARYETSKRRKTPRDAINKSINYLRRRGLLLVSLFTFPIWRNCASLSVWTDVPTTTWGKLQITERRRNNNVIVRQQRVWVVVTPGLLVFGETLSAYRENTSRWKQVVRWSASTWTHRNAFGTKSAKGDVNTMWPRSAFWVLCSAVVERLCFDKDIGFARTTAAAFGVIEVCFSSAGRVPENEVWRRSARKRCAQRPLGTTSIDVRAHVQLGDGSRSCDC